MKKFILILLLLVMSNSYVFSQSSNGLQLYINSGAALPAFPQHFSDYWDAGISFGAGASYPLYSIFSLQLGLNYTGFLFDDKKWLQDLDKYLISEGEEEVGDEMIVSGGMRNIFEANLDLKANFSLMGDKLQPYLIGGFGLINMNTDDLLIYDSEVEFISETVLALGSGGGFVFNLNKETNVFIEGYYKYTFTKDENKWEMPIDLDGVYSEKKTGYYALKIGVSYNLAKK